MSRVFPPQPSGALAALHARQTDVIFVAHTGLGLARTRASSGAKCRSAGRCTRVYSVVPASDLPAGDDERIT